MILSTDRLYLRELIEEDAIHFFKINNDPECIKYTGDIPFESLDAARIFLKNYLRNYKDHKMGRWAVCLKTTNDFIGWCGLKYHSDDQIVDVGYRFYKKHWNAGYATEATKASLAYGFNSLELDKIVAHVHVDNNASHRVALKSGLVYIKDFDYDGTPAKFYEIKKIDYLTME